MNRRVREELDEVRPTPRAPHPVPPPPHHSEPFLTTPAAIIIGSLIIGVSILLSGGVLKVKGLTADTPAAAPIAAAPSAPLAPTASTPPAKVDIGLGKLPVKGDANAKVAVVEFADMRCPFCKQFFDTSEPQLLSDFVDTGKVKFAFRHFEFLGPSSVTAGNAAECANEQGKFWEMYDYFYKNQPPETDTSMYTTDKLTSVAGTLGLNTSQFSSCLSSTKYNANLTADQSDGSAAGVSGTPSFIIGKLDSSGQKIVGGQLIVGAVPYATIKDAITTALGS